MTSARFAELYGRLEPAPHRVRAEAPPPSVILSNLSHGECGSPACDGVSVRFVARGAELYRIAGRTYRVGEGEFMISPQALAGDVEIRRGTAGGTLGLCLFLPGAQPVGDDCAPPAQPMVLSAQCSRLGAWLGRQLAAIAHPRRGVPDAHALLQSARPHIAQVSQEIARHVDAVQGKRETTRYDAVRRANAARTHLHATPHRGVPLAELAKVAGLSPFQLVRTFRDCFGDTPALYHRKLRLQLVHDHVRRTNTTWQQACERYGFAGGSAFSQAWRRTFGISPRNAIHERGGAG